MRNEKEVRKAVALLGTSLAYDHLRHWVFGPPESEGAAENTARAWIAFATLGWIVGADEALFSSMVAHCELKLREYEALTGEKVIVEIEHVN